MVAPNQYGPEHVDLWRQFARVSAGHLDATRNLAPMSFVNQVMERSVVRKSAEDPPTRVNGLSLRTVEAGIRGVGVKAGNSIGTILPVPEPNMKTVEQTAPQQVLWVEVQARSRFRACHPAPPAAIVHEKADVAFLRLDPERDEWEEMNVVASATNVSKWEKTRDRLAIVWLGESQLVSKHIGRFTIAVFDASRFMNASKSEVNEHICACSEKSDLEASLRNLGIIVS